MTTDTAYCGECGMSHSNTPCVPVAVIGALKLVRDSGDFNMLQRDGVTGDINDRAGASQSLALTDAAEWLSENPKRYMEALKAMGESREEKA